MVIGETEKPKGTEMATLKPLQRAAVSYKESRMAEEASPEGVKTSRRQAAAKRLAQRAANRAKTKSQAMPRSDVTALFRPDIAKSGKTVPIFNVLEVLLQQPIFSGKAGMIRALVLAKIYDTANRNTNAMMCWPTIEYLCTSLGRSKSSVCRAIKWLERNRWIGVIPDYFNKSTTPHNIYYLLDPRLAAGGSGVSAGHPATSNRQVVAECLTDTPLPVAECLTDSRLPVAGGLTDTLTVEEEALTEEEKENRGGGAAAAASPRPPAPHPESLKEEDQEDLGIKNKNSLETGSLITEGRASKENEMGSLVTKNKDFLETESLITAGRASNRNNSPSPGSVLPPPLIKEIHPYLLEVSRLIWRPGDQQADEEQSMKIIAPDPVWWPNYESGSWAYDVLVRLYEFVSSITPDGTMLLLGSPHPGNGKTEFATYLYNVLSGDVEHRDRLAMTGQEFGEKLKASGYVENPWPGNPFMASRRAVSGFSLGSGDQAGSNNRKEPMEYWLLQRLRTVEILFLDDLWPGKLPPKATRYTDRLTEVLKARLDARAGLATVLTTNQEPQKLLDWLEEHYAPLTSRLKQQLLVHMLDRRDYRNNPITREWEE